MNSPQMVCEAAQALEKRMARRFQLGVAALSFSMFERWGAANREELERAADMMGIGANEPREIEAAIKARVRELRKEDPDAISQWADAHIHLLQCVIDTSDDTTTIFVAKGEMKGWAALKDGARDFMDRNSHYIHYPNAPYRALFGFDIPAPLTF